MANKKFVQSHALREKDTPTKLQNKDFLKLFPIVPDQIECPVCKGVGKINAPKYKKDILLYQEQIANQLREQKFSIREIMRIMNFKSPNSVARLLK